MVSFSVDGELHLDLVVHLGFLFFQHNPGIIGIFLLSHVIFVCSFVGLYSPVILT